MLDSYLKECLIDNEWASIETLDITGQEQYAALQDPWIRDSDGCLLVYSVTSRSSFNEISRLLQHLLRVKEKRIDEDKGSYTIAIIATNVDLEDERQVSSEGAKQSVTLNEHR